MKAAVLLAVAGASVLNAQEAPSILWQTAVGGNSSENVNVIAVSEDGQTFVTAGVSYSFTDDATGNREAVMP